MRVREVNQRVRSVYGTAMTSGATSALAAGDWLSRHGAVFGAEPLELDAFRDVPLRRGQRRVLMYKQTMDGLPVVGSSLRLMADEARGQSRVLYAAGRIAIQPQGGLPAPTVTPREATAAAQAHPTGQALTAWSEPELVAIYDDPPLGSAVAYPAWKCIGSGGGAGGAAFESYTFYVDAVTGEVVRTHSNVLNAFDITGTVTANATPAISNVDPEKLGPNTLPLSNLWLDCPNVPAPVDLSNVLIRAYRQQTLVASAYTDSNGNYTLDVPDTMEVDIEAHLVGPMWSVLNGSVANPYGVALDPLVEAGVTAPNTVNFEFNPTPTSMNEEETAFVDAHFQIDRTLQYLDLWYIDALPDVPIVVNSSELGCNAQYLLSGPDGPLSPGLLRFTRSATSCANHAYSTVIAHEYGHYVLIQLLGIDYNSGIFHEGFADTLAHLVYDTEIFAQDRIGCNTYWRDPLGSPHNTYPNCPTVIFPSCIDQHCLGQLLSATWLRILDRMRLRYPQGTEAWDRTRTLHLDWIYLAEEPGTALCGSVQTPQAADEGTLIEVLTADDDDDTLANGTPHCEQILGAFADGLITPSFEINCDGDSAGSGRSCYADFDDSTGPGVLDIFDYLAFQSFFLERKPYACDCDTTTGSSVCDVFDFICFQAAFAAGCNKE